MKRKSRLQFLMLFFLTCTMVLQVQSARLGEPRKVRESASTASRVCVGGSLQAEIFSPQFSQALVTVVSVHGKVIMQQPIVLNPGHNLLKFQIAEIPSGAYFLQLRGTATDETMTFVVQ